MDNAGEKLVKLTSGSPEMEALGNECRAMVEDCGTALEVETARVELLGKKGRIPGIFKGLSELPTEQKRVVGQIGNLLLMQVTGLLK